jgi:hypothetical protein
MNRTTRIENGKNPFKTIDHTVIPSLPISMPGSVQGGFSSNEFQMDGVAVPRTIAISSKMEHNSIEQVRRRLRSNKINHLKFEPATEGEMGEKYF